jgi:hypothetical protein
VSQFAGLLRLRSWPLPRSVITKLEAGGTARAATIRKLARFLEVEPEDLMAEQNER